MINDDSKILKIMKMSSLFILILPLGELILKSPISPFQFFCKLGMTNFAIWTQLLFQKIVLPNMGSYHFAIQQCIKYHSHWQFFSQIKFILFCSEYNCMLKKFMLFSDQNLVHLTLFSRFVLWNLWQNFKRKKF